MLEFIKMGVRLLDRLEYRIEGVEGEIMLREYLGRLGLSITLIKKAKRAGIFVDGEPVTVRKTVRNGMSLTLMLPSERSEGIKALEIPLKAYYEDESLAVFYKPTNMPTHPSRGNSLPTLAEAVMARYGGNLVFRAITRLDRDTSGLVLVAKNPVSAARLSESMKQGKIFKRYEALVSGIPSPSHGIIDRPIKREREDSIKRICSPDGKSAVTEYSVKEITDGNAVCEIILHTGRTHQIRVHMASIGHPLVGDFLYGERGEETYSLECKELRFPHPTTGKFLTVKID